MTRLDESELAAIRAAHPQAPGDYLEFLRDVGWGGIDVGPYIAVFMIYSGPGPPSDIFGEDARQLDTRYLVFGDDFSGNASAFDLTTGAIVKIWHEDLLVDVEAASFSEFILRLLDTFDDPGAAGS